jgi:hypothetical protein
MPFEVHTGAGLRMMLTESVRETKALIGRRSGSSDRRSEEIHES